MSDKHGLRVLHAAVSMNPSVGVLKQMDWEQQAAVELGLSWRTVLHTPKVFESSVVHSWSKLPSGKLLKYVALRRNFYKWLLEESKKYDLVLLRFSVHDPWQLRLTKQIGNKLLTVHHTKEEPELLGETGLGKFKALLEHKWGRSTLKRVLGFVAVTPEVRAYEQSRLSNFAEKLSFVYPNGIVRNPETYADERKGDVPELLFVASTFSAWQGLDKFLKALSSDPSPCVVHLVGQIDPLQMQSCKNDHRIVLHGHIVSSQLNQITAKAWCGLSSFALERKDMTQACTLKVREYLDAGLPVYAGHQDSGLPDDFPFFTNGEITLSEVLAFAKKTRSVTRAEVSEAARPYISKTEILAKLYSGLESQVLPLIKTKS
jgi:hypothetical protein